MSLTFGAVGATITVGCKYRHALQPNFGSRVCSVWPVRTASALDNWQIRYSAPKMEASSSSASALKSLRCQIMCALVAIHDLRVNDRQLATETVTQAQRRPCDANSSTPLRAPDDVSSIFGAEQRIGGRSALAASLGAIE